MSGNLGFGLAWLAMAGLYALLASGGRQGMTLPLATACGAVCASVAISLCRKWARERARRIGY